MECIFCKIIDGEIPAVKVLDEDLVLAFMDINPSSQGHLLVVPKQHTENIFEISEGDLAAVTSAVRRCAKAAKEALEAEGVTILQLNGRASDQIVPHLHIHVIPRWENDGLPVSAWEMKPGDMEEIKEIARKVQECLS
ncbi:MAG: HIT family protein [Deltaproteobacteria bacterium]|nr:HIT family protein [Deltaproteobacteria bacterium]MBW2339322.1 HIT family protein [Deltaproteobacteria bacterium]